MRKSIYELVGKRVLDMVASAAGIVVLSPVLVVTAIYVRSRLGTPVVFRQERPGLNAAPFNLYKFRSMTDARDENGDLLPDAERMTDFGALLRTTSLDELPELFNVLKGDMSLVGPRPLLTRYLPHYTEGERRRFAVHPGLTGYAQIHGRNSVSWDDRLGYDTWYAENVSLSLDIRIIVKTLLMVVNRQGVTAVPTSTMQSLDVERAAHG